MMTRKAARNTFFKVSFPDASCANFYLESTNEKDSAVIQFIARSFRPRGWVPSFLVRFSLRFFDPTVATG
jgi:hypothetical protein